MKDGNYASFITYQIENNTIKRQLPNLLTGYEGEDADKCYHIGEFFNDWKNDLYSFLEKYFNLIVYIQSSSPLT